MLILLKKNKYHGIVYILPLRHASFDDDWAIQSRDLKPYEHLTEKYLKIAWILVGLKGALYWPPAQATRVQSCFFLLFLGVPLRHLNRWLAFIPKIPQDFSSSLTKTLEGCCDLRLTIAPTDTLILRPIVQ